MNDKAAEHITKKGETFPDLPTAGAELARAAAIALWEILSSFRRKPGEMMRVPPASLAEVYHYLLLIAYIANVDLDAELDLFYLNDLLETNNGTSGTTQTDVRQ